MANIESVLKKIYCIVDNEVRQDVIQMKICKNIELFVYIYRATLLISILLACKQHKMIYLYVTVNSLFDTFILFCNSAASFKHCESVLL